MTRTLFARIAILLIATPTGLAQCELQKLTTSSPDTIFFGAAVALSGEFAIMGTPYDDSFELDAGAAYVFESTPSGWVEIAQLFGEDPEFDDVDNQFGYTVAISNATILAGAPLDDSSQSESGAAFVFEYDGIAWNQTAKLAASDATTGMGFGISVDLDGDRALIGAHGDNGGTGAAYVFERSGTMWTETAKLTASDGELLDLFGLSVSLSGELALIGAHRDDNQAGSAYVFNHAAGWAEEAKLVPLDSEALMAFGLGVSLSGQTAVIGAYGDDTMGQAAGAAYIFQKDTSTWTQRAKLLAADGQQGDSFGRSVDIEARTILIGASANVPGSAYLFRETQSGWAFEGKLVASDGVPFDNFGSSVSIAGDTMLVGAMRAAGPFGELGAAYLLQLPEFATAYCYGVACPCGNDDPVAGGCANSIPGLDQNPQGAKLAACESAGVAADDLVLTLSHLPPNKFGLFYMGGGQTQLPFGDGFRCVDTGGVGLFRYNPPQNSGSSGLMTLGPGIVARSQSFPMNGHIDPGETWYFQGWYRDPMGPCGTAFNLSNGLAVTFEP